MEERIRNLKIEFFLQTIIFSSLGYDIVNKFDKEYLKKFLKQLQANIEVNLEWKAYSQSTKNNLYKILSLYRDNFKELEILNTINELITMLNKANTDNVENFLLAQFEIRYLNKNNLKKIRKMGQINIFNVEESIYASIANDYFFLESLLSEDDDKFLVDNVCDQLSLASLKYMLEYCPDILQDSKIRKRIFELLECNISMAKQRCIEYENKETNKMDIFIVPNEVNYQSNDCLKKMKKIKTR